MYITNRIRITSLIYRLIFLAIIFGNQLIDKNGQLLIYPFELIKIRDTCHSQIISHTSHKSWTFTGSSTNKIYLNF
ncbi:hypothetical protein HanRHA438_Chr09g0405921 [Helianthus annuus]|nr:hypothetical protein HanRHA438_Chr09g0405921 [Helianthus annuus]